MNQDAPKNSPAPEENVNAEAIRQARQRVRDRERRMEQDRLNRDLPEWERSPDSYRDTLDTWFGYGYGNRDGVGLYLTLGLIALTMVASFLGWMWQNMRWPSFMFMQALDTAVGARILGIAPFLIWAIWGAVFGGVLGYWLIAPAYGDRENRSSVLLVPLFILFVFALLSWGIYH